MAQLYARKITERAVNPMTGAEWTLADVPERWRAEVEALLNGE